MRLACRAEFGFDPKMNLQITPLEPTASALRKIRWLGDLGNIENPTIEFTRKRLATGGHRELHVFESLYSHLQL